MSLKQFIGGVVAIGAISGSAAFGLLQGTHTRAAGPFQPPPLTPMTNPIGPGPNATNMYSPGVAAIHPSIVNARMDAAAVTAADVVHYINQGSLVRSAVSGAPVRITKLLFLSAGQARKMLGGEWIGRPADAPVVYVEMRGTFQTGFTPVPLGVTVPATLPQAIAVFDAHTGNLLLSN